ncbi:hypothetical protein [Pseudomonas purpurea]|uniref:hypothetical protein n=1 Tax=Pseudomonas purpurea TaxID=3136737 RepID=UPI0032635D97
MKLTSFVVICALSLLTTACSNVVYPTPIKTTERTGSATTSSYDDGKEIISATWMESDFSTELKSASSGDTAGFLIKTSGYTPGEKITIFLDDKRTNDDGGSYNIVRKIIGTVDKHGEVRASFKP